jgi:disulfide bond formation protein DsbB
MLNKLQNIAHSRWYWLALVALGLSFIAVALLYQYVLEQLPCVLCIQVRILMLCITLVALIAFILHNRWSSLIAHVLTVFIAASLLERSYQLLGTERGFVFGDCGFDLGLPSWLALDTWFPALFRVEASCGYTPELVFGITMAEALIVFSAAFVLTSLALTTVSFVRNNH